MVLKPFRDIPAGLSFFGLSFLTFILFRFFSVSVSAVVTEPVRLQRLLLSDFIGLGELTGEMFSTLVTFGLPLVSVSVLFSVVSIYLAWEKENLFLAPATVAAGALAGISFAGAGFTTVGLGLGLVVSTLVVQRDIEESQERTRLWKIYPATSDAAEKGFLTLNAFLALGLAGSVLAGFPV